MPNVSISDAEWQVMNVVWDGQPLTAQEVIGKLADQADQADWAPATVKTMLHRLVKKGVLTYELQGNRYVYRARARRRDCVRQASRSFLEPRFRRRVGSLAGALSPQLQVVAGRNLAVASNSRRTGR